MPWTAANPVTIGNATKKTDYDKLWENAVYLKGVVPPGATMAFAMDTEPDGWLECDGGAISRTTYADLFAAIGDLYGVGDGSTTFNLPDYRGKFLRGWAHGSTNDPDRASRTDAGDGSTTGDNVGTNQADGFKAHVHTQDSSILGGLASSAVPVPSGSKNTGSTGGNETRPININVMVCIKT